MLYLNETIVQKKLLLKELTKTMDIPFYRHDSVLWLLKNLSKKNISHKNYDAVIKICEELKRMGVH